MTKQEAINLQVSLQSEIQRHGINLVECGKCDAVLFHRTPTKEQWQTGDYDQEVVCPHCDTTSYTEDCPDVYYEGMPEQTNT
jgi:uncharacterized Zn finger protein (UPF0148 family)